MLNVYGIAATPKNVVFFEKKCSVQWVPVSTRNIKPGDHFTLPKFHHIERFISYACRASTRRAAGHRYGDSLTIVKNQKGDYVKFGTLCTLGKIQKSSGWSMRYACQEPIKAALENKSRLVYLGKHKVYNVPKIVDAELFYAKDIEAMDEISSEYWFNTSARIYHTFYSFGTHETIQIASCYLKFLEKIERDTT